MEPLAQGAHPDRPPAHARVAPDALRRHQRLSLLPAGQDPAAAVRRGRLAWLFVLLREPLRAPPEPLPDHGGSDSPSQPHLRQLEDEPPGDAEQRAAAVRNLLQGALQPGEVRRRRRGRGCRHGERPARRPGLGRLLGCAEDRRRSLALRRRGRFLSEVDHPAGPESIRAPLLHSGLARYCTQAAAAGRWTPTSATRSPSRGSTSP